MKIFTLWLVALAASAASAQEPLFADGLNGWTPLNTDGTSFTYDAGILRVSGKQGWMRSPREYGDFELRGQVRFVEANSDSGIFLRVESGTDFILGWPGDAYQVQMREISENRSDNPLPLVNLYRHRVADGTTHYQRERVFALYTGVGAWQDFTIRVTGSTLTVELNGELVTEAEGLENPRGYLGFQSETGVIEYRELTIRAL
ncbi:MAG: DUF1080 domain-containing protein [Pseudomonadota bacterium]|nr:DUF1080 domain-containing protein [Pseudomonadota bacterium]